MGTIRASHQVTDDVNGRLQMLAPKWIQNKTQGRGRDRVYENENTYEAYILQSGHTHTHIHTYYLK